MAMTEHRYLPWKITEEEPPNEHAGLFGEWGGYTIDTPAATVVVVPHVGDEEWQDFKAEFKQMVNALNNHAALVEAVRQTLDALENMTTGQFRLGGDKPIRDNLRAVLDRCKKGGE